MKLELIRNPNKPNSYKIVSSSNHQHPALIELAKLLRENNKSSDVKIGIYNIFGGEFSSLKTIYSYIAERKVKVNRKVFYSFIKGLVQLPNMKNIWKGVRAENFDHNPEFLIEE